MSTLENYMNQLFKPDADNSHNIWFYLKPHKSKKEFSLVIFLEALFRYQKQWNVSFFVVAYGEVMETGAYESVGSHGLGLFCIWFSDQRQICVFGRLLEWISQGFCGSGRWLLGWWLSGCDQLRFVMDNTAAGTNSRCENTLTITPGYVSGNSGICKYLELALRNCSIDLELLTIWTIDDNRE